MSTITDTPRPELPRQPRRGLVGPLILVGLGAVLLLNNFGLLGWGVWETLLQLWPLLLIAFGLELMLGRRSALAGLLIPLALLGALAFALWWSGGWAGAGVGLETTTVRQPLPDAARAEITLAVGVGELRLTAMQEPEGLIAGSVRARPGSLADPTISLRDGVAVYTLRQRSGVSTAPWGRRGTERWDLRLSREIPLRLALDTGAGTTSADLSGLRISDLQVNSGVGTITITLPDGDLRATINGGVGTTTVNIPAGAAARLTIRRGLGDVRTPAGYRRQGDVYESPGYADAARRIDLTINGGVGSIAVRAGE